MNEFCCANCGSKVMKEVAIYHGRNQEFLGEFPLYYNGASPLEPDRATEYFCGVYCSNEWFQKTRAAR